MIQATVQSILALYQVADAIYDTVKQGTSSHVNLHQTATVVKIPGRNLNPRVKQTLALHQHVSVWVGYDKHVKNTLPLRQRAFRVKEVHVAHLLALRQSARTVKLQQPVQHLKLLQSVNVSRGLNNSLNLVQTVRVNVVRHLSVTDTLVLIDGCTVLKDQYNFISVFVAPTVADYDPANDYDVDSSFPQIPPLVQEYQKVLLTDAALHTVELSVPEFGDQYTVEHQRINRKTRDLDLVVFRDSRWPIDDRRKMKFTRISQGRGKALLDFMHLNAGVPIEMVDHEGVKWTVIILNPEAPLVEARRAGPCKDGFEIELEFQGKMHK